jgi:hypothetical protein
MCTFVLVHLASQAETSGMESLRRGMLEMSRKRAWGNMVAQMTATLVTVITFFVRCGGLLVSSTVQYVNGLNHLRLA